MLISNGKVVTFGQANEIIKQGAVRIEGALVTDGEAAEGIADQEDSLCRLAHCIHVDARGDEICRDIPG